MPQTEWLPQEDNTLFDPTLFGDYRENQDAFGGQDFGGFFNEAFPLPDLDIGSPFNFNNMDNMAQQQPQQQPQQKHDLMQEVEKAQNTDNVKPSIETQMLSCNKIWYV